MQREPALPILVVRHGRYAAVLAQDQPGRAHAQRPPPPSKYGCGPGATNFSFCDASKPAAWRALELARQLTVAELVQQMDGDMPAITRLGVPPYHYGYEALHGPVMDCPFADRCYTSFACSSASAASFNRTLWWAIGKAQSDEVRGCNNDGAGVFSDLRARVLPDARNVGRGFL